MLRKLFFLLFFIVISPIIFAQVSNATYLAYYSNPNVIEVNFKIGSSSTNFMGQANWSKDQTLEFLNESIEASKERHGLEKTGRVLTYVGVPLTVLGAVMVAGSDELYYNCYNGVCEGDARGAFGIISLISGIGLTGTGVTLWVIGSKK